MKIILAEHSGFCMGVRNAILRIVSEINTGKSDIYVHGPLIHNPQTIEVLSSRGLKSIQSLEESEGKEIAVRTHGITKEQNRYLKKKSSRIINLTCPRVARVQSIIKKHSSKGAFTLIIGDKDHAEVSGLISYAEKGYHLISDIHDINTIPEADSYILVSQTTFDRNNFERIISSLPAPEKTRIFDTICDSTLKRQSDLFKGIKSGINTLVVVGGKNSANTARLAGIGYDNNIKTFHIETEAELKGENFSSSDTVLVTAGASTPGWIINNVLEKLYNIRYKNGNRLLNIVKNVLEFSVRTHLISAIGSFFITLLTQRIMFSEIQYYPALIAFMYIFSMYSVNNYFDRDILKKSNSYKYTLYNRFGIPLLLISGLLVLFSIRLSGINNPVFYLLISGYTIGFLYSTGFVKNAVNYFDISIIKKIYASKIVTGLGWVLISVFLPVLWFSEFNISAGVLSFAVFSLIFSRQLLLDKIAFQSDLIMGRETIPIWIGMKKTGILITLITALPVSILIIYSIYSASVIPLIMAVALLYYRLAEIIINRQSYVISLKYELLVDFNFILIALAFTAGFLL